MNEEIISKSQRFRDSLKHGRLEAKVYLQHVLVLFWPGGNPGQFAVHPGVPGHLGEWSDDDLRLLVEEGRRQLDRQHSDLERIQNRAQFLFTITAGLLALFGSQASRLQEAHGVLLGLWVVGLLVILLALLGGAALMSAKGEFGGVDACLLSSQASGVLKSVGRGYANSVGAGENTIATRITVLRDAVFLTTLGGAFQGGLWIIATLI